MIICKRLIHTDDHLQEAGPSGWSGWSILMIICKRPVHSDDHLQEADSYGSSFARGWSLRMIICICCYLLFVVDHCLSFVIVCLKIRDFCRPLPLSLQMLGINSNTKHLTFWLPNVYVFTYDRIVISRAILLQKFNKVWGRECNFVTDFWPVWQFWPS